MKKCLIGFLVFALVLSFNILYSEELPRPTYDNSIIISWSYSFLSRSDGDTEMDYIKTQFGAGLYTTMFFSNFLGVDMGWVIDLNNSSNEIQVFKDRIDKIIAFAKKHKVDAHLVLGYGMARSVEYYNDAKIEDIRYAQWYNDNNISSQSQMSRAADELECVLSRILDLNHFEQDEVSVPLASSSIVNQYVFSTPSRYARKMRAHLEAKVSAVFEYLKQQQDANPDIVIIVSAPGESELNYFRINNSQHLQDYFCDYSPFAVLEFRDWIKHEGLYAEGEKYAGEGYENGGARYQGASGLANFNSDFGTSFNSWDLKYYNWSLSDLVDTDYIDGINPDPNVIPVSQYTYNGMMPASGSNYIAGGFDPPRVMKEPGTDDFYDLWHLFRETMIYHYVKDMSSIARESGFPKKQYYTHQIPGDYLFGTRPNDPLIPILNPRYYCSASPMWTANVFPDIGLGVTLYDINYGTWYARTTRYGIDGADAMSDNWSALEYNPDVIPSEVDATVGSVSTIYNQIMKLYNSGVHVINFFKWKDKTESTSNFRFKDTNRGTAAKQFFDVIKDKARQPITTVFTPKRVEGFSASYNETTGLVNLSWSSKIWIDLDYVWNNWGDFKEFVIYRGLTEDFTTNTDAEIVRKTGNTTSYIDMGFPRGTTVYYKIAAVNVNGEVGSTQTVSVVTPEGVPIPIMAVSRDRFNFAYVMGGSPPPSQTYRISNNGAGSLNWTATDDAQWLTCNPSSGIGSAVVTVLIDPTGLTVGTYNTTITISDPLATNSPQTIIVYLTVKNSTQNQLPFGSFDTPADNSTVRSSVPVTGWVLDDVGVESVKIYRDPLPGGGKNLVYIGDALFVEGARPDIENAYPDYPCNYKAGWGYMMLTNFLPNGGNGTFKLYAIAKDSFGYEVTLGTKTIICDNANAIKPFGAIDAPTQGGTASGTDFINWGWALTPMPNSIPTDGSTINVYIDGVKVGNPVYNIYRADIASLFPGYANSDGAVGYFFLDTTQYADGVHTIQWTATDFAGNTDGIGSRYFTVQNAGSGAERIGQNTQSQWLPGSGSLSRIPFDRTSPIRVKTGFNKTIKPQKRSPMERRITLVESKELEPIEIHFDNNVQILTGCLVVNNAQRIQTKPLPIGSTLDSQRGIFYWLPGLAFVGDYTFDFVIKEGIIGKIKRKRIKIKILPKFVK
jgi:hypothetical protein